jgi:ABC-type branched-subunit amino acid transport system ATPase component
VSGPVLTGEGITRRFGGMVALDGVDLAAHAGDVTVLLGPNGAGKSTLVNCLTGVDRPTAGRVLLDGNDVTGRRSDQFARAGVARTFQHARAFKGLTATENVMVGGHGRSRAGVLRGTLRLPSAVREERELRRDAEEMLVRVGLGGRGDSRPEDMPLADERRLEIARCLAGQPRVLLLDEPAAGLGEEEAQALADLLRSLAASGLAIVLIEHHLELALGLADTVYVLDFGKLIFAGTPAEVRRDQRVQTAYIGPGAPT